MTSMLLVLLLLAQTEGPDNPPAGAMELPRPASSARRLHYLARLEATGFALLPDGGTGGVERYVQLTPMITGTLVRWRFGGWLYAVGQGGTLLFSASDGTLRPGAFASLGLGVDHAR